MKKKSSHDWIENKAGAAAKIEEGEKGLERWRIQQNYYVMTFYKHIIVSDSSCVDCWLTVNLSEITAGSPMVRD